MNEENDLRLFREMRKHPWIPEHKIMIDGEIAKLLAMPDTKNDGVRFKKAYEDKMATYEAEQELLNPTPVKEKKVEVVEPVIEEEKVKEVVVEKPKKKGRPAKESK